MYFARSSIACVPPSSIILVLSAASNDGNCNFLINYTIFDILGPSSTFIFPKKLISISTTTKYLINIAMEVKDAVPAAAANLLVLDICNTTSVLLNFTGTLDMLLKFSLYDEVSDSIISYSIGFFVNTNL